MTFADVAFRDLFLDNHSIIGLEIAQASTVAFMSLVATYWTQVNCQ